MTHALTPDNHATYAHHATAIVRHRSLWAIVGLNVITVGLYSVYWWYMTNRELRDLGRSLNEPGLQKEPALSALAFFFGSLVVPLIWTAVTTARRVRLAQDRLDATGFLRVWVPVALLAATLPLGIPVGGGGAAAAATAAAVALRTAAIGYLQVALNEVCRLSEAAAEQPAEPMPPVHLPAPAGV